MNYTVFVDSNCDIDEATLNRWGAELIPLSFTFDGDEKTYRDGEIPSKEFYSRLRSGNTAHTSALCPDDLINAFTPALKSGKDVLYCTFSSGLSSTFATAKMTAAELMKEYPERRIVIVDSLCESAGYGMLMYLSLQKATSGADIDETASFIENTRLKISHRFTVGDLKYLKKGGRINSATALAGTVLGIKPLLHMNDEGKLVSIGKVRGRKASIEAIADAFGEKRISDEPVFICHSDCESDALFLKNLLQKRYGVKVGYVASIGAVIGSHCGPDTLAVFFLTNER